MLKPIQFTVPVYGEGVFALLEDRKDNFYGYYHRHEELQITCILKGKGTIMVGNMVQSFQENDLFVLKPNEPHLFEKYAQGEPLPAGIHAIHVFVNLARMQKLFVIPEFDQVGTYLTELGVSQKLEATRAAGMQPFFAQLMEKSGIPKFTEFVNLLHSLTMRKNDMVSIYSGVRNLTYSDKDGERISTVYKYTFDYFNRNIDVGEVAALVHMTPSSFCKFFKKHTMKTFIGFFERGPNRKGVSDVDQ